MQDRDFKATAANLANQSRAASAELQRMAHERAAQDLLMVIRDIDDRIQTILNQEISPPGSLNTVTISHMNAEAERLSVQAGESHSYERFIAQAQLKGTVIEAKARQLIYLIKQMRIFLQQFSELKNLASTPTICYYSEKIYSILYLAENIGGLPSDTRTFFASVSDKHG